MKKALKVFAIIMLGIIFIGGLIVFLLNEKEPQGARPEEARILADKMLMAIDVDSWNELRYVSWTFADRNHYIWDKKNNTAKVRWKDKEVMLDVGQQQGTAIVGGSTIEGSEKEELVKKAWEMFCNDSFWLNAPAKVLDAGTALSVVTLDDGGEALKVTYSDGGVTPGDSYVWILDENGLPIAYKMWVKIIPIGGMEFSWEDYVTLPGGAKVSTTHESSVFTLHLTDISGGMTLDELNLD